MKKVLFLIVLMSLTSLNLYAQKAIIDTAVVLIDTFEAADDTTSVTHYARTHMSYSFYFESVTELDQKIIFEMSDDASRWVPVDSVTITPRCYHNASYDWWDYVLTEFAVPPKKWIRIRSIAGDGTPVAGNAMIVRRTHWQEFK